MSAELESKGLAMNWDGYGASPRSSEIPSLLRPDWEKAIFKETSGCVEMERS